MTEEQNNHFDKTRKNLFSLFSDPKYNLSHFPNKDYLVQCFDQGFYFSCSSFKLSAMIRAIGEDCSIFQGTLQYKDSKEKFMYYNYENISENNFMYFESLGIGNNFEILFLRLRKISELSFGSKQYDLEFNNKIFYIFLTVVLFGIINLGFTMLFLGIHTFTVNAPSHNNDYLIFDIIGRLYNTFKILTHRPDHQSFSIRSPENC